MNKLTALIEAAKASIDAEGAHPKWLAEVEYKKLANPATILELCALLEKAEEALKLHDYGTRYPQAIEALAAIKQWKEQT